MNALINIFKIPELRRKILFTAGLVIVYRLGSFITIPGVNPIAVAQSRPPGQSFLDVVNVFSGGALFKLSIFSLGIMPYISASIIMSLLTVVIPQLARMQREGEDGRRKINQYTRYGTVLLCAIQALFILVWAVDQKNPNNGEPFVRMARTWFFVVGLGAITTGTILLMWMGEQITERGIGNGASLIIFSGIIAQLPSKLAQMMKDKSISPFDIVILVSLFLILIALTILLSQGVRKIPLQYGKKMQGRRLVQARSQSIQFKLNSANVMPIIFASSLLLFPQTVIGMLGEDSRGWIGWRILQDWLNPFAPEFYKQLPYYTIYTILIIFFAYFYTAIYINPQELSENLKKYGGFVPGIRPGTHTKEYVESTLNRIILPGAIFLAGLALAPYLIINFLGFKANANIQGLAYTFGGTSLLIIVGVALDTLKQIESQLIMRNYDGFMKKGRIKGR
ncbi:MAG TPA: preprotein translocase subunit SecY [Leptospiraceae bacterium]|jgi:preprotein translocase subunit SecY|nr:preprotein translocase subunit SecY [Leptospirales bacterium]HMW60295.1 preprotein translocase subunit SecY [Leptospiraceae bacterium]HMX57423.1 preprotein translocase subunit SecY [Leptospiraceae bacterium]HNE22992.1 preprotein translocase subunit SecY [Leptospiraceae bacterium]HNJ03883.1 preprotein translocase subunit SecY [Leptospiraceae bacterium]